MKERSRATLAVEVGAKAPAEPSTVGTQQRRFLAEFLVARFPHRATEQEPRKLSAKKVRKKGYLGLL